MNKMTEMDFRTILETEVCYKTSCSKCCLLERDPIRGVGCSLGLSMGNTEMMKILYLQVFGNIIRGK